ncbi:glycosyltransferase family 4 protein [Micrococcus flavus]|uniref:Glycosyltransferase involved in cell wall biosynthesis n=1 Tax=Micrococcus flavus TaxID=384602 RepID=A0A7W7PBY3_9MICC|nr:glycosyltransferase family 4 protein [Micrococcus flavus]MBB4882950.1 glycosyltransferase involved in cell wall biosynthesis [Micrococcus flavus]GGK41244.1 hypothetical protein GCM10007073_05290 [Micrococcus flavus]
MRHTLRDGARWTQGLPGPAGAAIGGAFRALPESTPGKARLRRILADYASVASPSGDQVPAPTAPTVGRSAAPNAYRGFLHIADVGDTYTEREAVTLLQLENAVLKRRLFREPLEPLPPTPHEDDDRDQAPERVARYLDLATSEQGEEGPLHLVVLAAYPSADNAYGNGFVHRRVMYFRRAGVRVHVAVVSASSEPGTYVHEGVPVIVGRGEELRHLLDTQSYASVGVHFLDRFQWERMRDHVSGHRLFAFMHGYESRRWIRTVRNHRTQQQLDDAVEHSITLQRFWREVLAHPHGPERFVFVSRWWRRAAQEDLELVFPGRRTAIVHNVIDTDLFRYMPKDAEQRFKVLWVRSAANLNYGPDLAVAALQRLRETPWWDRVQVRVIGDGKHFGLFEEAFAGDANVAVERRFADQAEIARLHREYGIFLVPTRADSQGVSRDEAMASGLVPVTNRAAAIPEFTDEGCAVVAGYEDVGGLTDGMVRLMADPALFTRMSAAAAARVRTQSSPEHTVAREMRMMGLTPEGEVGA